MARARPQGYAVSAAQHTSVMAGANQVMPRLMRRLVIVKKRTLGAAERMSIGPWRRGQAWHFSVTSKGPRCPSAFNRGPGKVLAGTDLKSPVGHVSWSVGWSRLGGEACWRGAGEAPKESCAT